MSKRVRTNPAVEAFATVAAPVETSSSTYPVLFAVGILIGMASFTEEISVFTKTIEEKTARQWNWQARLRS